MTVTSCQGHANQLALVTNLRKGNQGESREGDRNRIRWDHEGSMDSIRRGLDLECTKFAWATLSKRFLLTDCRSNLLVSFQPAPGWKKTRTGGLRAVPERGNRQQEAGVRIPLTVKSLARLKGFVNYPQFNQLQGLKQ